MATTIASLLGGDANHYNDGAQDPAPMSNQKGHAETGGSVNDASSGRNHPIPPTHPITGTVLPETTGIGGGTIHRGGRSRSN